MKDIRKLAVILLVVCLFCCSCCLTCSKETMSNWIERNANKWIKIAKDYSVEKRDSIVSIDPDQFPELRGPLRPTSIRYSPHNNTFSISFKGSYDGETSKILFYAPSQTDAVEVGNLRLFLEDTQPAKTAENFCRWDGLGADGTGYMSVEQIAPSWFYIETYYPT